MAQTNEFYPPILKLKMWIYTDVGYKVESHSLRDAIFHSGLTNKELQLYLGEGFRAIEELLIGMPISHWMAWHIECALTLRASKLIHLDRGDGEELNDYC